MKEKLVSIFIILLFVMALAMIIMNFSFIVDIIGNVIIYAISLIVCFYLVVFIDRYRKS